MSAPVRVHRRAPVWPIWILAMPAAVSIWAGWVGLGQLTGFGVVQLLPGIWDELTINTAITLPIGMEAYAAYAMFIWLATDAPKRAKDFARASALGALILGALGQMAYHLMAAAGVESAPWQITAAVSCLPVGVLGMAAALAHLVRSEEDARDEAERAVTEAPAPAPAPEPVSEPFRTVPAPPVGPSAAPAFRAVPNWSAGRPDAASPDVAPARPAPAARDVSPSGSGTSRQPAGGTSRRTSHATGAGRPARRPAGPRSDDQLADDVRRLAESNGGEPPSAHKVKRELAIGHERAQRLLAEFVTAGPSGPDHNGRGTGREGTR